ncbi:VOC family protein [Gulosibacter molinativorax]|uniref:VOC family protein n=1 Tax=Gulosibacter molinativorax TaxID=256821 RepID=A0ABT7C593_9MICO|nr:VOC family protein [Gulosibacter molinativorax]MDJ1370356.1 VOC family protein [Gulosibacter molinativorax]QUY61269.1 3-demethylubiquinone-9 3-O-methyltransferase [Gulosibacter molinativorax]
MQFITPSLWFNGNASEAVEDYLEAFSDSRVLATHYYPSENLLDFQRDMAGKVLSIEFHLGGLDFVAINAGDEFRPNPALSFMVNFDPSITSNAEEQLRTLWARLVDGGEILMELDSYPFSKLYGWVEDKYGVNWQLILTNPEGEPRPHIIPSFLFGGENVNRARAAVERWTSVFPDSKLGTTAEYPEQTGPAEAGSLMFSEFTLGGQWFTAMDSGVESNITFTEGVSLQVNCADQAEIDRYWDGLSRVPESEVCGWCKDEFGVSWQIIPTNLTELMAKPRGYETFMAMKKIEIDQFGS